MNQTATNSPLAKALLVLASVLALLLGLWAARQLANTPAALPTFASGTALPAPRPLTPFTLTDHHGNPFNLERFKGAWTFLFFGYTHCPDVCPTTLSTMNGVLKKLAAENQNDAPVHMVFVSIDPERDTVQRLAEYVPYFNKDFLGVTGTPKQIDDFTKQLSILHMRGSEPADTANYTMDHTASVLLIDPQARFSAIFSAPHVANTITQDFLALRNFSEEQ